MKRSEHYRLAEKLLADANREVTLDGPQADYLIARAQVHATLAAAAPDVGI